MKKITTLLFVALMLATFGAKAQQLSAQEQQLLGKWAVAYDQADEGRGLVYNITGTYDFYSNHTLSFQSDTEMLFSLNQDGVDNTIVIKMKVDAQRLWKIEGENLVFDVDPAHETQVVIYDIHALNNDPMSQLLVSSMYASTDALIQNIKSSVDVHESYKINEITADQFTTVNPDGSLFYYNRPVAE